MKIRVRILPNGIVKREQRFSTLWFFDKNGKFLYCKCCAFREQEKAIEEFVNKKRNYEYP